MDPRFLFLCFDDFASWVFSFKYFTTETEFFRLSPTLYTYEIAHTFLHMVANAVISKQYLGYGLTFNWIHTHTNTNTWSNLTWPFVLEQLVMAYPIIHKLSSGNLATSCCLITYNFILRQDKTIWQCKAAWKNHKHEFPRIIKHTGLKDLNFPSEFPAM